MPELAEVEFFRKQWDCGRWQAFGSGLNEQAQNCGGEETSRASSATISENNR